jgi:hypothetical protein
MREQPLTSVHDALREAKLAERDRIVFVNANFKCHPAKKAAAEAICEAEGTTLSAFLRACMDGLVTDYAGPKMAAKLEASAT